MKLYVYDHCPFCVRAKMIFGFRSVPYEEVVLLNDDERMPIGLVGSKQVPILIKPDGLAMAESLDIVRWVDEYAGGARLGEEIRPQVQAWVDKVNAYSVGLRMPRVVKIGLPEFATQAAIDYFVRKKTLTVGNFEQNLLDTPKLLAKLNLDLQELAPLIPLARVREAAWSMEDIMLFPLLRNLTIIKGLQMPPEVEEYVKRVAQAAGVALYSDRAI